MRSCLFLFGCLLATSQLAARAAAQSWFAEPTPGTAHGLRAGELMLHAGVGAEAGWVSNVFLADDGEPSAVLRVSPHFELATVSAPAPTADTSASAASRFDLHAGLRGAFKHYFATEADTDIAIDQDVRLSILSGSIIGIELFEEFARSIDPFTDPPPPSPGIGAPSYARDRFAVGTRLQFSTVGEVLRSGVSYRFELDHFEDTSFRDDRNRTHALGADVTWEFYPRTALFFDGDVAFRRYSDLSAAPRASRSGTTRVKSRVGLHGAITPRLEVTAAIGYGAVLVRNDHDEDTWLGQLEARWRVRDDLSWMLACERGLDVAFQGDHASVNRIKTRLDYRAGALLLALKGELGFVAFGRDSVLAGAGADAERDDILLRTELSGEYRFVTWLAGTAEVGYAHDFSDFEFPVATAINDAAEYSQLQFWLGVRAFL